MIRDTKKLEDDGDLMSMSVSITSRVQASPRAHAARDAAYEEYKAKLEIARQKNPKLKDHFGAYEVGNIRDVDLELDNRAPAASKEMDATMAKIGFAPVDKIECKFGVHGGRDGEITYWYQRNYKQKN